jgi:hypothetical protein
MQQIRLINDFNFIKKSKTQDLDLKKSLFTEFEKWGGIFHCDIYKGKVYVMCKSVNASEKAFKEFRVGEYFLKLYYE